MCFWVRKEKDIDFSLLQLWGKAGWEVEGHPGNRKAGRHKEENLN